MAGDPCSLLWPPVVKQACENTRTLAGGNPDGTTQNQSVLGLLTNPQQLVGGFRHFMFRFVEGTLGVFLILIGTAELIKPGGTGGAVKKAAKVL